MFRVEHAFQPKFLQKRQGQVRFHNIANVSPDLSAQSQLSRVMSSHIAHDFWKGGYQN